MAVTTVRGWLERKRRNECILAAFSSVLAFGGGLVIVAIAFGFFFIAFTVAAVGILHGGLPSNRLTLALSSFLTGLLFIEGARTPRGDLPTHFAAGLWVIRECFCAGPWLVFSAGANVTRAIRMAKLDLPTCEQVLSFLAARNTSASKEDLLRTFPELVWSQVMSQLLLLDGVLFFRPDLSRVSLTEPLRLELRKLLRPETRTGEREQPHRSIPVNQPRKLSCYELLGVSPAANLAEIKLAYRKRMKECHPDRFASLGKEYQQLAEEWTKAINAAHDTLISQQDAAGKGKAR